MTYLNVLHNRAVHRLMPYNKISVVLSFSFYSVPNNEQLWEINTNIDIAIIYDITEYSEELIISIFQMFL